jgi:transposase
MSIVGGLDLHRKQLTFDYADRATGELTRAQIAPADRRHLALWLPVCPMWSSRWRAARGGSTWWKSCAALEWWRTWPSRPTPLPRGVVGSGPKPTGRTRSCCVSCSTAAGARSVGSHRSWCWSPGRCWGFTTTCAASTPAGWVQRIHGICFHQGNEALGNGGVKNAEGRARLRQIAAEQLSTAGQLQIATAVAMLEVREVHLDDLRRRLVHTAKHLCGAKTLTDTIYGVGPVTGLALCCWLGGADRFSSSRKAVRFAGLDVTVYSSDSKRGPGYLSRQGPPVLRWCLYEAGKTSARASAPDPAYYTAVKQRVDGKRAALSVQGPPHRPASLPPAHRTRRRRVHHRLAPTVCE